MKLKHLSLLRDPATRENLTLEDPVYDGDEIVCGTLRSPSHAYPITNGIPRFVPDEGYSDNFGYQWNRWARVQFEDQNVGGPMQGHTTHMFQTITQFSAEKLRGKTVLDIGCGPGRFTDVAVGMGAAVIALDYSSAIDAAKANFAGKDADILFVQGDALQLPLKDDAVEFSYSIGVLHHTPSPYTGVREAYRVTKAPPGGGGICLARLRRGRVLHLSHRTVLALDISAPLAHPAALSTLDLHLPVREPRLCAGQDLETAKLPVTGDFPHGVVARLPMGDSGYLRCRDSQPSKFPYAHRNRKLASAGRLCKHPASRWQ